MPWTVEVGRAESGLRMRVYPHSTGATGALYCRLPDYEEMSFVLDYLHGGDTFVDVGANVGSYTLLAASVPGTQVVAFEPASIAAGRLRENVALNALGGRVRVAQMAVGAQAGAACLTVGLDCINKLVEPSHCGEAEAVVVTTLDDALASQDAVSVVKIDVEGAEEQVLIGGGGGTRSLRLSRPLSSNATTLWRSKRSSETLVTRRASMTPICDCSALFRCVKRSSPM